MRSLLLIAALLSSSPVLAQSCVTDTLDATAAEQRYNALFQAGDTLLAQAIDRTEDDLAVGAVSRVEDDEREDVLLYWRELRRRVHQQADYVSELCWLEKYRALVRERYELSIQFVTHQGMCCTGDCTPNPLQRYSRAYNDAVVQNVLMQQDDTAEEVWWQLQNKIVNGLSEEAIEQCKCN